MRIVVTADLHYQPTHRERYVAFARWVADQQPDCFILAGDIGHPLRLFRRGLQLFRDLTCPRLVLAGNHDVYHSEHDSRCLWERTLPHTAYAEGFIWLEDQTVRLGSLGIVGTMGWYDYSSHASHLDLDHHDYRLLKRLVNHDADFINWPWSDRALARYLARSFGARLGHLHSNPDVRQILVVTHVPIFQPAVPDYPQSEFWSLLRAYMGNFTLGHLVRRHAKVTHVVSGHIHRPGRWTVEGEHGPIEFHVVGSEKGMPEAVVLTFDAGGV